MCATTIRRVKPLSRDNFDIVIVKFYRIIGLFIKSDGPGRGAFLPTARRRPRRSWDLYHVIIDRSSQGRIKNKNQTHLRCDPNASL